MLKKYTGTTEDFKRVEGFNVKEENYDVVGSLGSKRSDGSVVAFYSLNESIIYEDDSYLSKPNINALTKINLSKLKFHNLTPTALIDYIKLNQSLSCINISGNYKLSDFLNDFIGSTYLFTSRSIHITANFCDFRALDKGIQDSLVATLKSGFNYKENGLWVSKINPDLKLETNLPNTTVSRKLTASNPEVFKR